MQHERLTYKRTENLGNYCSESVEVSAVLNEGDDVTIVFNSLRDWAEQQLAVREAVRVLAKEHQRLANDVCDLRTEKNALKGDIVIHSERIDELKQQYSEISKLPEFINKLPETPPKSLPETIDDIPY